MPEKKKEQKESSIFGNPYTEMEISEASALAEGIISLYNGYQKADALKESAKDVDVQKANAELEGRARSLAYSEEMNRHLQTSVISSAIQNRGGESVKALAMAQKHQYKMNVDYSNLATGITVLGLQQKQKLLNAQASSAKSSAYASLIGIGFKGAKLAGKFGAFGSSKNGKK